MDPDFAQGSGTAMWVGGREALTAALHAFVVGFEDEHKRSLRGSFVVAVDQDAGSEGVVEPELGPGGRIE